MNINARSRRLKSLFQHLDQNQDGVSVKELQTLDQNNDGSIDPAEAKKAGVHETEDQVVLNKALKQASSQSLDFDAILFPDVEPSSETSSPSDASGTVADRLTFGGFDLKNPDLGGRLTSLKQAFAPDESRVLNPNTFNISEAAPTGIARMDVYDADTRGINDFSDIVNVNKGSVSQHLESTLGRQPTDAEIKEYIQTNGNAMAQQLGDDLSSKYSSYTSVGLTGDVDVTAPFRSSGPDDPNVVVCTNIHAAVAAYRQEVLGQEAYVMTTNGDDQAHIVTVYFDEQKQSWNIQNYGTVVETDAKNMRQLFEEYLPEQRHMTLGKVTPDGIGLERDTRTALGEREYRFRSQLGAGNHQPGQQGNHVELGNRELAVGVGGLKVSFDPRTTTAALNYHTRSTEGNTQKTQGLGVEAQDHTNAHGFQRQRVDAKYEWESVTHEQVNTGHEKYTRQYTNIHAGIEDTSETGQIYWPGYRDTGAAARVGGFYSLTQNHLFGTRPLRFELGTQFNAGATATVATQGNDFYTRYATRMLGDAVLEGQASLGIRYDKGGLSARTGLTPRIDLANINGVANMGQQLNNIAELDAYGEVSYQGDKGRVALMGQADLRHPGVFEVGAMTELNVTDKLSWANSAYHQNDPLLGNQTGLRTGVQYAPAKNLKIHGNIGSNLQGQGQVGAGLTWSFD